MNEELIRGEVKKVLAEATRGRVKAEDIGNEDNLVEKLGIDSIMILEVLVSLEEKFGFSLEEEHLNFESFLNVNNIVALISSLL